ncbi:MAG: DUF5131 family protein [Bacteroidales bacterium]
MALNKQTGNMYGFIDATWNPITGQCDFQCEYCYMKRFNLGQVKTSKDFLKDLKKIKKLNKTNKPGEYTIFIGSGTDICSPKVSNEQIEMVLKELVMFRNIDFLIQTKNPYRLKQFGQYLGDNIIVCTTIESNIDIARTNAPDVEKRIYGLKELSVRRKMITIEPIFAFLDLETFVELLTQVDVVQYNIGANTDHNTNQGKNKLSEPSSDEIKALVSELKKNAPVHLKSNLKRLL